jgi:hypothetical protein
MLPVIACAAPQAEQTQLTNPALLPAMIPDVIELHDRGGMPNPTLDIRIEPLGLTDEEQRDLVEFLTALTGTLPDIRRPALPK